MHAEPVAATPAPRTAAAGPVAARTCHADPQHELTAGDFVASASTAGNAQPLPEPVLTSMQARFGSGFGDVRVHTGEAAASSAASVGARAYTLGNDVVFAAGNYAPGSAAGDRLIAHELGHVLEQRRGPMRLLRAPGDRPVTDPRPALRDLADESTHFLQSAADYYALLGPVGPRDRRMVPLVRVRLERVGPILTGWLRIRDQAAGIIDSEFAGDPARMERLRLAYRHAVRALIEAASQTAQAAGATTTSQDLFAQHQQLIHEWGWPGSEPVAGSTELLDGLSQAQRSAIRVDTDELTLSNARSWFATNVIDLPEPAHTTVVMASNVPAAARRGLRNLALSLTTGHAPAIGLNRSTTFLLDVSPVVPGRATYRLTRVHIGAHGHTPASTQILLEQVGVVHQERDATKPPPGTDELFRRYGFVRGNGWADESEFAMLQSVLARIPAAVLNRVRGIRFNRVAVTSIPDRAAEYSIDRHTIDVADAAYNIRPAERRYQAPGGTHSGFEFLITHEIGHAVDQQAIRLPLAAANQTSEARNQFLARLGPPDAHGNTSIPAAQMPAWNTVRTASETARTTLTGLRGISGSRFATVGSNLAPTNVLPPHEHNAFRTAAQADGGTRITSYSDHSWAELFAESFSMYLNDPETMQRLRPHLFAFFQAQIPVPAAPAPEAGP